MDLFPIIGGENPTTISSVINLRNLKKEKRPTSFSVPNGIYH